MNYLKKMSVAAMNVIPKNYKKKPEDGGMENGAQLPLFNVIGIAEEMETGQTSMGEWTAFIGTFKATACQPDADGVYQEFRGKKLFLPDVATDAISDALAGSEGGKVEFAMQIGMRRVVKLNAQGEETGAGYEYTMKPLIEIDAAADPLAHLSAKIAALPAPSKEDAPAKETKKK